MVIAKTAGAEPCNDAGQDILTKTLLDQYGPLMAGDNLVRALGFSSASAMRQSKRRGMIGVRIFNMPNRRGVFALTSDVALYITKSRLQFEENAMDP
jgi:hypothetical protein